MPCSPTSKSLRLTLVPDRSADRARRRRHPGRRDPCRASRLQYADGACGDWREKLAVSVTGTALSLTGSFAGSCGEKGPCTSRHWPANLQVEQLFRALWKGTWRQFGGRVRDGEAPPTAKVLLTHESPPLAEAGTRREQNGATTSWRGSCSRARPSRPATPEAARERVAAWLQQEGCERGRARERCRPVTRGASVPKAWGACCSRRGRVR